MTVVRSCVIPGCPQRRELEGNAYACPDCQRRLVRKLADIETYLEIVNSAPSRSGDFGPRRPGYESRPPLRLDVVAMLDPRTEINGDGPDDVVDEVPNIAADLGGWWRVVCSERPDADWDLPPNPLADNPQVIATALRTNIGWICRQPWVDEFARDIGRVHGALRRACGDQPGKPVGKCIKVGCGGDVFRRSSDPTDRKLKCAECLTEFNGLDLVKIRLTAP